MNVIETALSGVLIIEPTVFSDSRGFFVETYRRHFYQDLGLPEFVQSNHSRSQKNVLRGLHYQLIQPQGKLVRVVRGSVLDVAVDVRLGSPTFGQWESCILDDVTHRQFYVPENFAHGFLVLSEIADVEYQCTHYYHPDSEQCILWNDPDINIDWCDWGDWSAKDKALLSAKDNNAVRLAQQPVDKLPQYKKILN